ncbi:translocation/assembly module TamB domain-containing protein [Pararhizobium sp. BT-229]|uniref:translocation/assembly module TamB domain-containing protein n=1 Tax=Pararhizobium sp. BT-229 TaxID=2986923 RepID=UPI0021F74DF6|nr:translocation/assembly module TamB domain-containing protein [Pararhizobium sp. BT-229]MCV9965998.1 translocation/assembly module TamB domain-containing protein [Pararhizobium sp. BT-229]
MNRLLRFLKAASRWLIYCLGFGLVAIVLLFLFAGFTAPGARLVALIIEKYASTPDQIVRINDPSALLTGDFTASSVTLFDSKGIYAEIREVAIDWSPTALFSTRFEAAKLSAGSVRLERLPIPSQETREVRETFSLPLDIKVDTFNLKEIVVGKEIAGVDQFLSAQGKVNATNASIAAALAVAQRDRPDAKAIADIVFNPAGNELKLETTIEEPKGGLLAKAMRLPGEPAISVSITGDGPLTKWTGTATAALDGNEVLKVDGEHTLAPDGFRTLALKGGGTFSDLLPAAFRPLFEGTTDIDLSAALDGTTMRIQRGNFSTGALTFAASGTYSTAGQNDLQASLTGTNGPIDFRLPLENGEAQLSINNASVSLIGEAQTAVLDIGADIGKATLPQGEIEAIRLHAYSDGFNLSTRTGPLKTTIETGATRFVSADLDRLVKGPVKIDGTISLTPETASFDPITLESPTIGGTLVGSYTIAENTVATGFKLFAMPAVLPPALASKFETTIAITGNLGTGANGSVNVSDLVLKSGTLEVAGSAALETGSLTAAITGTVPEIGKLLSDAKGAAAFSADVTGPLDALAVKAKVTSSGATLAGRSLNDLAVNADATFGRDGPTGTVTASGSLDGQAINAKADILTAKGTTSVPSIEAVIGANTLKGSLDLTKDFEPNGALAFNLPDLGLLAAMAGQTASGDLAGSASIKTENGVTSVAVKANGSGITRGDLVISKPAADITIADLKALAIKGAVTVEEVVQGTNRLAGLKLGFEQQGPKTNFALDGTYDAAPLLARGDLQSADGRTTINLQSFSAVPKKIPLELANPTTIVIENGAVNLQQLAVKAYGGTVTLTGSAGEKLDVTATLAGLETRLPLEGGEAHIVLDTGTASIRGDMQTAVLDVVANVAEAALPQGRFDAIKLTAHSDAFNLSTRSGAVAATIETGATQLTSADLDRLVKGPLKVATTLDVTPEAVGFSPITITSTNLDGALAGSFNLASNSLNTTFKLSARPAALPAAVAAKFDTPVEVAGTIATGPEGAVDITNLNVNSGTVQAAGSVALKAQTLTAALTGTVLNLGKVLADAEGSANFTVDATGPLDNLGVKAEVTSRGATLAGRTLSDLQLTADATANPKNPQAKITATGALGGQAINVKADLVSKDGRTSVPVLEARIGENTLNGAIDFTTDFLPQGTVNFNFPDVGLLAAMAGEKASGDLSGSASIKSDGGITSIALKANGSGIKRGDLVITRPAADITIADLKALAVKGNLSVETFAQGANRVSGLKLDFAQQANRTNVTLDGQYDGAPLSLRADIQTASGKTTVNLASFAATPKRIPVKLSAPTTISIENGSVSLQKLTIAASSGTIAVTGSAGERLDLAVNLSALPASLANTFVPSLGADGAISGTVGVKGTAGAPVVAYDLRWANAAVAQAKAAGVGALDVTAKGQFANNTVRLDTTISGAGGLSFRGGGTVGITGNRPIDMKLSGNLPFGLAAGLLAQQGFTLTGAANVDLTIKGAATAPQITGTISTSGARLVDVRRNLAITDLAANVSLDGRQATISRLTGRLASGGSLDVGGTIGIAPGSGFPADLTIRLDNATYVDGSLFNANVDGAMTLKGSLTAMPVLGGKVTIRKAAITIPEKLPASLSEINIKHRNAPANVRRMQADVRRDTASSGGAKSGGIAFDLAVSAPSKLFVRGRGIDAELGGDLTIRGTAAQPAVSGGFEMRRGRLEILGKRLDFSEGTISFGGNLVPTLDLDATSSAGATTITVNVAGVADNPTITFSSSPALPQDEILAQLIFNRSLSNLSALQIAQLASAVSQLAGGGSNSLLDGLRNKLGVDDLDVSTDANGGAQVTAGKYLNDRTYLELQSGSEAGGGKAIINLDVGRGVKLRGEAGSSGTGGGIFYEKEY